MLQKLVAEVFLDKIEITAIVKVAVMLVGALLKMAAAVARSVVTATPLFTDFLP